MADIHRPYRGELRPSSTAFPHANGFGSAPRNPIYTTAPPSARPLHTLALPAPLSPPAARRDGGSSRGSIWCFSDPEMKRRRRVASYKAYSVEGNVKASLRRGLRWFRRKCAYIFHG